MPLTPFHYPFAYILYEFNKKLKVPGLIVGSFIPDIEIPVIRLLGGSDILPSNRLILHSLIGAATLGTLISLIGIILLYPTIISRVFKIDKERVEKQCTFSIALAVSCLLGAISHVLLDVVNHSYNPVFWPFQSFLRNPINCSLGSSIMFPLIHIPLGLLFIVLVIKHKENYSTLLVGE